LTTQSRVDCQILLKFGTLVHYGSAETASLLKPRMTGGQCGLKWQCVVNLTLCHLFCLAV